MSPEISAALRLIADAIDTAPVTTASQPDAKVSLLSKRDAALAIGVSTATIDRLVRQGAPYHRVGARKRFDPTELQQWCDARGRAPTTPPPREDPIDVSDVVSKRRLKVVR